MRVLVAEDELVSRMRLKAQLTRWGYEVVLAKDGDEAWAILQRDDAPRLAIVDWMMPGMDGPEVCRRLRLERPEPYVYVVLLTGRGSTDDLVLGLDAGADDYLTKPFDAQELQVRLRVGRRIVELQAELVSTREALRFQATHDPLTGALNRAAALDMLTREVSRAQRSRTALSVAMVDLDHFKSINDTHGHPAGDEVLRTAVRRCQGCIRPYDSFSRYGGEEFLLLLPGCDGRTGKIAAERIREAIRHSPVPFGQQAIPVTCSIGLATLGEGMSASEVVARADLALYRAKHGGRDRVEGEAEISGAWEAVAVLAS
jgi:two-component system cell cycle response regulator